MGSVNRFLARLLEQPFVYSAWQRPFADKKLAPLIRGGVFERSKKILDVGCGPGTNALRFEHADYTGIDVNPLYMESANQRYKGRFIVGDASHLELDEKFDCVLANSLFHHLDDDATDRSLRDLHDMLTPDGCIHVLDLVLPPRLGAARALARLDRGDYPRPLERWREIFFEHYEPLTFEPYSLGMAGVTLWHMVYFQGKRKG